MKQKLHIELQAMNVKEYHITKIHKRLGFNNDQKMLKFETKF